MSRGKIVMADDHRMVAEGLRSLLEPTYECAKISCCKSAGQSGLAKG
jgi:DNA-binding NarL/FixJ family response regulator